MLLARTATSRRCLRPAPSSTILLLLSQLLYEATRLLTLVLSGACRLICHHLHTTVVQLALVGSGWLPRFCRSFPCTPHATGGPFAHSSIRLRGFSWVFAGVRVHRLVRGFGLASLRAALESSCPHALTRLSHSLCRLDACASRPVSTRGPLPG